MTTLDVAPSHTVEAAPARPSSGRPSPGGRPAHRPTPGGRHKVGAQPTGPRRLARADASIMLVLTLTAAAMRLFHLGSAYDVYVDEYFYKDVARSSGSGHVPPLNPPGWGHDTTQAFLLHPPGFFVLLGIWQHLFSLGGGIFAQIDQARSLNAVLAALTVAVLYRLGQRLGGRWVGVGAAALFALDPFDLRQNGRVLLETATLLWIAAGYLVLVGIAQGRYRHPRRAAVAGGVLFGCAILTKDMAAVETVGALLVLVVLGWGIPRRLGLLSIAVSVGMYLSFVLTCVVQGFGGQLWLAKTVGVRRLLGLVQTTGFNRAGSVPLSQTMWTQAASFGTSYLVVAVGAAAAVMLMRSRRADHRILSAFTVSAVVLLGYAVLFGTIEEQFLYFLSVPAAVTVVVVLGGLVRRAHRRHDRRGVVVRTLLVGALVAVCAWDAGVWAQVRTVPDNATQQAMTWLLGNAPEDTVAYSTAGQEHFMIASGLSVVPLGFPSRMAADHVRYVVLTTRNTDQNYSFVGVSAANWYVRHSHAVWSMTSRSQGTLEIFETDNPALW